MKGFWQATWLALVFLAVVGGAAPADLAVAAVVGAGLSFLLRPVYVHAGSRRDSLRSLPRFLRRLLGEVVRGTWNMLLVVLGRRSWRRLGYVRVPRAGRTELGVVVTGLTAGLSPGTVLAALEDGGEVLVFHVIDAGDPAAAGAGLQRFYRQYQAPVVP